MSLVKCPECGKEFSEYAKECPVCGMPTVKIKALKTNEENIVPDNKEQEKSAVKREFFTKTVIIKIIISISVLLILNIVLLDEVLTVSFWGLLLLNAVLCYAISILFTNYKLAFAFMVGGVFFLMLFHKLLPVVDEINADETHEKRHALFFIAKNPSGELEFLAPANSYIYNGTGKTLYLTSVGYGEYQFETNKHVTISCHSIEKGNVDDYFTEPSRSTMVRGGHSNGIWRNYLDYKKH